MTAETDSVAIDGFFKGFKFNSKKKELIALQVYNGYTLDIRTYKLHSIKQNVKLFKELGRGICPNCDKKAKQVNCSHFCKTCKVYF